MLLRSDCDGSLLPFPAHCWSSPSVHRCCHFWHTTGLAVLQCIAAALLLPSSSNALPVHRYPFHPVTTTSLSDPAISAAHRILSGNCPWKSDHPLCRSHCSSISF
ncbi:hypothetical protein O6H91_15G027700 [Diphasiastrum complanatum]|uniref:Uncharacterized protein n=1 Tax=Diphasiastrum complanatum TaxID=34168 RepID=A0ACC2BGQ5_DIPCM|nr:hypothetical protein O6H91_15G027700 [Diphasiastrum complanatum]